MRTINAGFIIILGFILSCAPVWAQQPSAETILENVDRNLSSQNRIFRSKMVIHGRRGSRTVVSRSWAEGDEKAFTEYLAPAREKGTKMLKLKDKLWMYAPSTDRTIHISGHMLRQSVMGSDLSYEDMMEDKKMTDHYAALFVGTEQFDERACWVLELTATTKDVAYARRLMWVDQERIIPLKEELFAKSGKLLKKLELKDVVRLDGRWFPKRMIFKDVLKKGKGTEFIIDEIQFDQQIPKHIFSKAVLRK
jgi:outer membrane lipoprotein-sorting protein